MYSSFKLEGVRKPYILQPISNCVQNDITPVCHIFAALKLSLFLDLRQIFLTSTSVMAYLKLSHKIGEYLKVH